MTSTDGDAFEQRERSRPAPLVAPRPRRDSAYVVYCDALGAPEVHIHVRVVEDLRCAALGAMPHETIGALLGRACRDDYGVYVVVEHVLMATPEEHAGAPGALRIPALGRTSMHHRAAQRHPGLEPVGWWRSHPAGEPRFSAVDRAEQETYPRSHHVGVVVAADCFGAWSVHGDRPRDPLGVYVGPSATMLACRLPADGLDERSGDAGGRVA